MQQDLDQLFSALRSGGLFEEVKQSFPFVFFHSRLTELMEATQSGMVRNKSLMIQLVSRLYMDLFCGAYSRELQMDYRADVFLTYFGKRFLILYRLCSGRILAIAYSVQFRYAEYMFLSVRVEDEGSFREKVSRSLQSAALPCVQVDGGDVEGNVIYLFETVKGLALRWNRFLSD